MSAPTNSEIRITNVRVADVINLHWLTDIDVIIRNGRIAALIPTERPLNEGTQLIDLGGRYLAPTYIDSHVHIESSMLTPERFGALVAPQGTGCVIADPHEIANVLGVAGIEYMLAAARHSPIDIRFMLPSCVPATTFEHAGATLTARDLVRFYDDPAVLGLAEVMNVPGVLHQDPELMAKIADARSRGKSVDGHAPLLSGQDLRTYAAAGISSDHECSTPQEVFERIACGMDVSMRQGSAAKNLSALLEAITPETAPHCMFCCDDVCPADILTEGHMQKHLRMAVAHGIAPITALAIATINAARHYGLDDIGAITVGRRANFVVLDTLTDFTPQEVWIDGTCIARNGSLLVPVRPLPIPPAILSSVHTAPVDADTFKLAIRGDTAHVIELIPHQILTKHRIQPVVTQDDGSFDPALNPGLVKMAVIERHNALPSRGLGIVSGYLRDGAVMQGAVAITIAHDSHNLVVLGDNDADMLLAVQHLIAQQGGMVLVKNGCVVDALPLRAAGLMSTDDLLAFAKRQTAFYATARSLFAVNDTVDPVLTLAFLALPVIPELRVTDMGLFDVMRFALIGVDAPPSITP